MIHDERADLIAAVRAARRRPPPELAKAIRISAGVSRRAFGDALGVDKISVYRWETGRRRPRGALADRYFELLDRLREASTE